MMLRLSSAKSFVKPLQIQRNQEAITVASLILDPGGKRGHGIRLRRSAGTGE